MHDIANIENDGIPGGFIATTEFAKAAEAQAKALGFEAAAVFVPHPIQDRTDEEIVALADEAFESVIAMVCSG